MEPFGKPFFSGLIFYLMLDWILAELLDFLPAKPFPGVDRSLGNLLMWAFFITVFFTWPGITLLAYIIPVSESLAFLLILGAWALFLLFFSATFFWLLLKILFL